MDERTFTDVDGFEIFYRIWPVADPKAVVVIAHGANEHSARYGRFATALNAAGYSAYGIDHRGHGHTAKSTGTGVLGKAGGIRLVDDVHQLVELAQSEVPGKPVVLFGHSMGSIIAQAYATKHSDALAAYVLCGQPGVLPGVDEFIAGFKSALDAGMGDQPVDALSAFNEPFRPSRTEYDWLSRDEAEVDTYIADPLCGDDAPMTFDFMHEMLCLGAPSVEPEHIAHIAHIPVLMITGERDAASNMSAQARTLEGRLRQADLDVTAHYYPEARHELLNEINRDDITADVVSWLDQVTG
jgi:alpha-beta hydrolase superfamily lysophospholipase